MFTEIHCDDYRQLRGLVFHNFFVDCGQPKPGWKCNTGVGYTQEGVYLMVEWVSKKIMDTKPPVGHYFSRWGNLPQDNEERDQIISEAAERLARELVTEVIQ
jgi:hypothetical protein